MAKLSTKQRKQLPKSSFAIQNKAPGSGSYPVEDRAHAINALARVSQHGTSSEKAKVKSKVYKRYPTLKK